MPEHCNGQNLARAESDVGPVGLEPTTSGI